MFLPPRRMSLLAPAVLFLLASCSRRNARAETLTIPHPDDPSKKVEAFFQKPTGAGPWPTIVLLHGHQAPPSAGGKDFVSWGVLDKFAKRGYLALAVSQPGYGNSPGPADFCGPFTQHAVIGVIERLQTEKLIDRRRIVIEGISRGALVAGLIAAHPGAVSPAGVVLISGLYDLPAFAAKAQSGQAKQIVDSITEETGGAVEALRARSVLSFVPSIQAAALILNGAKDDRTDPEQARRLAAEIVAHGGKARAIVYPNFGHQIPVETRDPEIDPFLDGLLGK